MDNDDDWIFVENKDESTVECLTTSVFEQIDQEDSEMENKGSYAGALLKNSQQNHQQQSVSSIIGKKEKSVRKRDDDGESMASYIEPKPGSQYRNPRDKAGKNKVHKGRRIPSPPPKNLGNSSKVGCTFCNPKLSNRVERQRNVRQQCSAAIWKDYDH